MKFSELPPELESEILSRVPATSLMKLQTSCKRWYVLFKDSRFVEKNLVKGKAATKVMLKQYGSDFSVSINMHGIHNRMDPYIEFTCKLQRLSLKDSDSEQVHISEIFHCNGLLLCTTTEAKIVVWNPCSGQTRWIQNEPTSKRYRKFQKCFLGYGNKNKSCHSYKILSFDNQKSGRELEVIDQFDMYDFNTDSWRVLDDVTHESWSVQQPNGVTLKGNAYSFAIDMEEPFLSFMLKFDFTTERFERLCLPFQNEHKDDFMFLSVVREEKLALLHLDEIDSSVMKIWMANSKSDEVKDLSWSNFLVVDLNQFETFVDISWELSFLVDEENKMVLCCDTDMGDKNRTRICIVGENIHKEIYRGTGKERPVDSPLLVSYVPSLVQIPARQTNSGRKRKK